VSGSKTVDSELKMYILIYYRHLMTANECLAEQHLKAQEWIRLCAGDSNRIQQVPEMFRGGLTDNAEALQLASRGSERLYEAVVTRILSECRDEVVINLCPACQRLARTPKARQCRFCGFDWHPVRFVN
jgi:hypothetical protein